MSSIMRRRSGLMGFSLIRCYPHAARCTTISTCGATTARSIAFMTRWGGGGGGGGEPARPLPSSIAKASRALKRGPCIDPHGFDAGKKIKGKKRHLLVDTLGLLLHAIVHPADIQDRDGGILLLATLFGMYPFLKKLFADGGYQGPEFHTAQNRTCELPGMRLPTSGVGAKRSLGQGCRMLGFGSHASTSTSSAPTSSDPSDCDAVACAARGR